MSSWRSLTIGGAVLVAFNASHCRSASDELPEPVQKTAGLQEPTPPPPPAPLTPSPSIVLTAVERTAIEHLRRRGASITVWSESGEVLVDFPLGALERKLRKEKVPNLRCGMGIEYTFTPDDTGPPMTDGDLVDLEDLPRLTRVNLAGTQVTAAAIAALRKRRPTVQVEDRDG